MNHPPRLSHLLSLPVLVAKLSPAHAAAHGLDDELADERVRAALAGPLRERLLDATWAALRASSVRLTDEKLLEKVATRLGPRPLRRPRAAAVPELAAFLLLVDVESGAAGEAARRALETDAGRRAAGEGVAAAGRYLAREITR